MADEDEPGVAEFFDALTGVMRHIAGESEVVATNAATPEQVDLVVELQAVATAIVAHSRAVLMGEPGRWAQLATMLRVTADACLRQEVSARRTEDS